ncbi:FHY3/FAR1 family [Parasponia andersonii]|uniref:FHY3/FAR1 family n=1 Tax=Parasponia andersonii TaxID=3476 RepID=A0A2P5ACR6_PARAD|nr:FHY3/FAR1 family [Parasponia andersonii]
MSGCNGAMNCLREDGSARDKVEDGGNGNTSSVQQISSLREEVGSNKGSHLNYDCREVENFTSNRELSMPRCHGAFSVENVGSNRDLSMQDFGLSTPVGSSSIERCEHSNFCMGIGKCVDDLATENVVGLEFETLEKAEAFYYMYSSVVGFNVQKDDVKHDKRGLIFLRRWVCSMEGLRRKKHLERIDRKRKPKALTRVGCCAAFRVNYNRKKGNWIDKEFDNIVDGREGSISGVQPRTCDVVNGIALPRWTLMDEDDVADGREASTSGFQPRTCDVVHGITLPPWTLTDEDNVANGREGSTSGVQPITCDVHLGVYFTEVNAETVTMLLQMVGGLHEVVMETILQARDKLKVASEKVQQKDREIVNEGKYCEESNDDPTDERIFGVMNLNEVVGNEGVTDKGGEVGRQNESFHRSVNVSDGSGSYFKENNSKKHNLKDVETSNRLPKKAKTNL